MIKKSNIQGLIQRIYVPHCVNNLLKNENNITQDIFDNIKHVFIRLLVQDCQLNTCVIKITLECCMNLFDVNENGYTLCLTNLPKRMFCSRLVDLVVCTV